MIVLFLIPPFAPLLFSRGSLLCQHVRTQQQLQQQQQQHEQEQRAGLSAIAESERGEEGEANDSAVAAAGGAGSRGPFRADGPSSPRSDRDGLHAAMRFAAATADIRGAEQGGRPGASAAPMAGAGGVGLGGVHAAGAHAHAGDGGVHVHGVAGSKGGEKGGKDQSAAALTASEVIACSWWPLVGGAL